MAERPSSDDRAASDRSSFGTYGSPATSYAARVGSVGLGKEAPGIGPSVPTEVAVPAIERMLDLIGEVRVRLQDFQPSDCFEQAMPPSLCRELLEISERLLLHPRPIWFVDDREGVYLELFLPLTGFSCFRQEVSRSAVDHMPMRQSIVLGPEFAAAVSKCVSEWERFLQLELRRFQRSAPSLPKLETSGTSQPSKSEAAESINDEARTTAEQLWSELTEQVFSNPEHFLAPGIHRRAEEVFQWWVEINPQLMKADDWFSIRRVGSEVVERAMERMWWDDVIDHLAPMGLVRIRSIVDIATTAKPYLMRLILDWSQMTWKDAVKSLLQENNLFPESWPEFSKLKVGAHHLGLRHNWAVGADIHSAFRSATDLRTVVNTLVAKPIDFKMPDRLQYVEIEGHPVLGPKDWKELLFPPSTPSLLLPFLKAMNQEETEPRPTHQGDEKSDADHTHEVQTAVQEPPEQGTTHDYSEKTHKIPAQALRLFEEWIAKWIEDKARPDRLPFFRMRLSKLLRGKSRIWHGKRRKNKGSSNHQVTVERRAKAMEQELKRRQNRAFVKAREEETRTKVASLLHGTSDGTTSDPS